MNQRTQYQIKMLTSTHKFSLSLSILGDFFPYDDGTSNGSYWSGYFTSRIALKG
jgi:hypothetical protein